MEQAVSEVMSNLRLPIAFGLLQNDDPMEFSQALEKPPYEGAISGLRRVVALGDEIGDAIGRVPGLGVVLVVVGG